MVIEPNKVSKPITVEFVLDVPTWSEDDNFCEPDCVEFVIKRRHNRVVVLKEHVKEKQVALLNDRKSYLLNVSPTGKNKMTFSSLSESGFIPTRQDSRFLLVAGLLFSSLSESGFIPTYFSKKR